MIRAHLFGVTMRYISGYNDDSEWTIERYGLTNGQIAGTDAASWNRVLANSEGEAIPSWTVFDLNYGFTFGDANRKLRLALGVINVLDTAASRPSSPRLATRSESTTRAAGSCTRRVTGMF